MALAQGFQLEVVEALLDDAERAYAVNGDEPYHDLAGRPVSVLANVPAAIGFLRASVARLRGDAALAVAFNRKAVAHLGEDDWLMRSFLRWNEAAADWLSGRLGPAERGLAEVLADLRAADEAVRRTGGRPTEVLNRVEGGAEFFAGFLASRVRYDLGEVQRAQGDLVAALATYRRALDTAGESSQPAYAGVAHVGAAQVLYERNELTAALDHATRGVSLCRDLAFALPLAIGLTVVARIRQVNGDASGALEAMSEAERVELSPQVIALLNPVPVQRAQLLLALGDVNAAAAWTAAAGLSPDDEPDYPREPAYLVLARVLLARSDLDPALALLQRVLDTAASQGRTGSVIEIQALRALGLAALGDDTSALSALAEALTLARPAGYVRVFADESADACPARSAVCGPIRRAARRAPHRRPLPGRARARMRPGGSRATAAPSRQLTARPDRAADRARTGGPAADRGGHVKPADRPRTGRGARHGQKARYPCPGQARRYQPHRDRRASAAGRPDPLTDSAGKTGPSGQSARQPPQPLVMPCSWLSPR
jgi:LuxR family transcriptional regulator, maltose regulon positive regulatory protein